ncbi:MAG: tryptophan-rich sensory protein, partial [Dehalococcoidia bacterium]
VNYLANALPINNKTTGQLSDQYPNLFVPAGLTFAIWGLIYIMLFIFVVYSLIVALRNNLQRSFISSIGVLFFVTCLVNMAWIFAWHYQMLNLSIGLMILLLTCLVVIYLRLSIGRSNASMSEKYLVHLPFSLYLGWISMATIANATVLLAASGWDMFGSGGQFWTIAVITIGIAIALIFVLWRRDIYFGLVVDWALIGILIKRLADPVPYQGITALLISGLIIISFGIIYQILRRRVY